MGLKTRATVDFFSVLKRLVALLPRMSDEDKDRVFQFVELAQLPERPLDQVYAAEALLSKYDPLFALKKRGEAIESRLKSLENAKKLRVGLKQFEAAERRFARRISRGEAKQFFFDLDRVQFARVEGPKDKRSVPVNQWWSLKR